ncbi:thermostable hemolysin [Vibrio cholerae]|nr:thermostable hemolysin [Vibrio cholerae]
MVHFYCNRSSACPDLAGNLVHGCTHLNQLHLNQKQA